MSSPQSKRWKEENLKYAIAKYEKEETCCILGCKSEKSIRNFKSLKGVWKVKENTHRKICVFHYNHDLKIHPRRKRKRITETQKPTMVTRKRRKLSNTDVFLSLENEKCCIERCSEFASVRNYSSLRGTWELKRTAKNRDTKKICNNHYLKDLKMFPRKGKTAPRKGKMVLEPWVCIFFFIF